MKLLDQETKKIFEECKKRALAAGLEICGETLEYIVTNRDMLELSPKLMIPTLYDYWVQDVGVVRNKWIYEVFPHNPYETVINTRPPLSFYNDNNPDWWNVAIFYHVLGHEDFFQNNIYFRNTWNDDFCGQALTDKRLINKICEERGPEKRWVDYVIEFALGIDNLVGYYPELEETDKIGMPEIYRKVSEKMDFYFGEFLRKRYEEKIIELQFYYDEVGRFNRCLKEFGQREGEKAFFEDEYFKSKFPEFEEVFKKRKEKEEKPKPKDILQYLLENSEFLNKKENKWMKDVIQAIRRTSLYFQPQIRTKIADEGWATFWHEKLFITDERIKTHEVDFSIMNARTTLDPRVGLNVYALGKHLFEFIEELAEKGKLSREYQLIKDIEARKRYDQKRGKEYAKRVLLEARKRFDDYQLINFLSDEDFQDFMDKYKLFLAGVRPHREKPGFAEIYIKAKSAKEYRQLLNKVLYHPPHIEFREENGLYLNHLYEGRTLVTEYIPPVLIGLEFLAGTSVYLETTEYEQEEPPEDWWIRPLGPMPPQPEAKKGGRVLYTCKDRKVERKVI